MAILDFGMDETYITAKKFEALTRIPKRDLQQVGISTSEGVPLLATLCSFHQQFHGVRSSLKGAGVDDDLSKIKGLQEHEKLTKSQITNQLALGQLIEKDIAKARMIETLTAYQNMTLLFIKDAALAFDGDNRRNEEKLNKMWNSLFKRIKDDIVEIKEWEEDGSLRLLPTRIKEAKKQLDDEAMQKEIDKRTAQDVSLSEYKLKHTLDGENE